MIYVVYYYNNGGMSCCFCCERNAIVSQKKNAVRIIIKKIILVVVHSKKYYYYLLDEKDRSPTCHQYGRWIWTRQIRDQNVVIESWMRSLTVKTLSLPYFVGSLHVQRSGLLRVYNRKLHLQLYFYWKMKAGYANPTTRPMGLPTGKLLKAC
jgi:hypothetical protein